MAQTGAKARAAAALLARLPAATRDAALRQPPPCLRRAAPQILAANARDMARFSGTAAFGDRLMLTPRGWRPWRMGWRRSPPCPTRWPDP